MAQSIAKAGVSPADMMKLHNRMFRVIDSSKNGMVSRDEFERSGIAQKLGAINGAKSAKEAFESADADHSGSVSESESMAYFGGIMAKNPGLFALISMMVSEAERKERAGKGDAKSDDQKPEGEGVEETTKSVPTAEQDPETARLAKAAYQATDSLNADTAERTAAVMQRVEDTINEAIASGVETVPAFQA